MQKALIVIVNVHKVEISLSPEYRPGICHVFNLDMYMLNEHYAFNNVITFFISE